MHMESHSPPHIDMYCPVSRIYQVELIIDVPVVHHIGKMDVHVSERFLHLDHGDETESV